MRNKEKKGVKEENVGLGRTGLQRGEARDEEIPTKRMITAGHLSVPSYHQDVSISSPLLSVIGRNMIDYQIIHSSPIV